MVKTATKIKQLSLLFLTRLSKFTNFRNKFTDFISALGILAMITFALLSCSSQSNQLADSPYSDPHEPLPTEGLNILFIGNSLTYSNDLPEMLERMLLLADIEVGHFESRTIPNFGLPDHWANQDTREQMQRLGWDLAILQQGPSATEGRPYLLDFTPMFADELTKVNAKTALYMVWPAQQRFFDFAGVSDSYQTAARSIDGVLFPAGEAWLEAWRHDPNINLYSQDRFHPSVIGTYLAALTMFEQITGLPLEQLPDYIPATSGDVELDPQLAEILRLAASEANRNFAQQPPILVKSNY